MAYRNNLLTGITELLVLSILNKMDSYIYEIVNLCIRIQIRTSANDQ